ANPLCQAESMALTDRIRGQARSYSGSLQRTQSSAYIKFVRAGLLANPACQMSANCLEGRFRQQAGSHGILFAADDGDCRNPL
ncbi:hypothetical protein, partial [Pseudomonas petrae]